MITFTKIKWKNFLSTGNTPIEIVLNRHQTSLVIGPNGSGKSTLLDALCFALFNRPFRNLKKEQIVNTINSGDTVVELEFVIGTKSYKIIRGIKPNIFEIYCDGVLQNQEASSVDYQKVLIDQILRLNYRAFIQLIILGSSSYRPFMKLLPKHRREVVEEMLDIRVLTHMNILARGQQGELAQSITDTRHKKDLVQQKKELQRKHLDDLKNRSLSDVEYKQKKIEDNKVAEKKYLEDIRKIDEEYNSLKVRIEEREKYDNKLKQLEKLETKIEQNIETHEKTLSFFKENESCPVCTQKLEPTFRGEKIAYETAKIGTLNDGMKDLMNEINKVQTKVNEFNTLSSKMYDLNVEVSKLNTSLDRLKDYTDNLNDEITLLGNKDESKEDIEKQLQELDVELEQAGKDLDSVIEEKKYVDITREILSDKGAKTKIVNKYLPIMNTLINQHLQAMDFFISFHLDEEFNETVKSRHMDTFDYNNFSEGEKMRIDLALLFTWRQIAKMKNSMNTNLLILDEIFDSSLDGQGTDDFFKIIKTLTKENIFVISHKGDILFDKFTNIIKFQKEHNFTGLQNV